MQVVSGCGGRGTSCAAGGWIGSRRVDLLCPGAGVTACRGGRAVTLVSKGVI